MESPKPGADQRLVNLLHILPVVSERAVLVLDLHRDNRAATRGLQRSQLLSKPR